MLARARPLLVVALVAACGPRIAAQDPPEPVEPSAPPEPGSARLQVVVDIRARTTPISPYIYGINGLEHADTAGVITLIRLGGTRYSTYNWENNASNAGHDPPANQNDGYLSSSTRPGAPVLLALDRARAIGAAVLVTVPMLGHVARDRRADGDVGQTPDHRETRFVRSFARGGRGDAPDLEDDAVHQDAFVRFVRRHARERGVRVFFALDNEPGGWAATVPRLRGERPATYRELVQSSVEHASMIRDEAPESLVFGPVSFGWPDMRHLGRAPDGAGRDFLTHYLGRMHAAQRRGGRRLLDVLDVHWYPVVEVDGASVCGPEDAPELARTRMQLPRSLYDPDFLEPSFVVRDDLREPVRLLPRLSERIRRRYPGTALAISEYAYGGGDQPSGAVAQADALGAFGRHGVFAAAYWPLARQRHAAALAAFRMFRRVDGEVSFGDRSLPARSSDLAQVSAWASLDSAHPGRVVIVLVGRVEARTAVRLVLRGGSASPARRFVLDAEGSHPRAEGTLRARADASYEVPLPPRSVTTLVFDR